MVTCNNGHYYDQEKNATCPYCSSGGNANFGEVKTSMIGASSGDDLGKTAMYQSSSPVNDEEKTVYHAAGASTPEQDSGEVQHDVVSEPVSNEPILLSGWLAVISEQGRGSSYTLTFGMNTIGRSEGNHVSIMNGDASISREKHALIIYDYENNIFFIKHGEGQYLSYVNGEVLLDTKQLQANDKIKIGATELIFIPLCSDKFDWKN
jgi:hypothetical protein